MYLFQRVEETTVQYNDARKNIGVFLMEKRSETQNYTMQQIAEQTFTSKATLTRYAQSLGFKGWNSFIGEFLKETHYLETHCSEIDPNMPFGQDDNVNEIIGKILQVQTDALQDTADLMKPGLIVQAGNMLLDAGRIVIFGMSPNTILAELFRRKMESIGILVSIARVDEAGMIARSLRQDDCAVIISYSGNNPARMPMSCMPILIRNKIQMIGITSEGSNYIRDNVRCCLTMSSRERLFTKITNYSTEESVGFILNVLFSYCFSKNYDENYKYKVSNSRELEFRRQTSLNEMKDKD